MVGVDDLVAWVGADEENEQHLAILVSLEAAAVAYVEAWTGRRWREADEVVTTELEAHNGLIFLPDVPAGAVTLERWNGTAWEAVGADEWRVDGAVLRANAVRRWAIPSHRYRATYETGYELLPGTDDVLQAPEDVKLAVRLLVEHWFVNRGAEVVGTITKELEIGVHRLLDAHRRIA